MLTRRSSRPHCIFLKYKHILPITIPVEKEILCQTKRIKSLEIVFFSSRFLSQISVRLKAEASLVFSLIKTDSDLLLLWVVNERMWDDRKSKQKQNDFSGKQHVFIWRVKQIHSFLISSQHCLGNLCLFLEDFKDFWRLEKGLLIPSLMSN